MPGQGGHRTGRNYALSFDGVDDSVDVGDMNEADGLGNFTIAQWFAAGRPGNSRQQEGLGHPSRQGHVHAGDGWAVLVNRDSATVGNHKIRLYFNGAVVADIPAPTGGWQVGKWYHFAFTRSGTTLKGFLDGAEKVSVSNSIVPTANSASVVLGKNDIRYFWQGKLDELRIYGRALPAQEIADLYNAGWQAATLTQSGAAVERTSWNGAVPAGLEGAYQVEMRGRDTAEHVEAVSAPSLLWRGEADNLKPRVTLSKKAVNTTTNEYTTVAEDYHLVETNFTSPCGAGVITRARPSSRPGTSAAPGIARGCTG